MHPQVNQKIEGHYDVCRLKGLTGAQGVMIPRANVRNLMLRPDVVDVSSGVERATGIKDHDHMRAFAEAARGVEANGR